MHVEDAREAHVAHEAHGTHDAHDAHDTQDAHNALDVGRRGRRQLEIDGSKQKEFCRYHRTAASKDPQVGPSGGLREKT